MTELLTGLSLNREKVRGEEKCSYTQRRIG